MIFRPVRVLKRLFSENFKNFLIFLVFSLDTSFSVVYNIGKTTKKRRKRRGKVAKMLYEEFVNLTGKRCSYADFEAWERLYMSSGMDKTEFCRTVKKAVADVPAVPRQVCVIYGRMPNGNTSYEVCELVSVSISTGRASVRHFSPRRCDIAWTTPDGMPCVVADRGRIDWIEE